MSPQTFTGAEGEWQSIHQPWELSYHRHGNFRWPGREVEWDRQWESVFGFAEVSATHFGADAILVDVGCGSRPVLDFFETGRKFFIDPLLDDYLKIPQVAKFWQPHGVDCLFSQPAEVMVDRLTCRADFVLCWNVLDHTYDPFAILKNIHAYAKQGGRVLIGSDLHERPHLGHPGIRSKIAFYDFVRSNFEVLKESKRGAFQGAREACLLLEKR